MKEDFEDALAALIADYDEGSKNRDAIISALELKLMELKEDQDEG